MAAAALVARLRAGEIDAATAIEAAAELTEPERARVELAVAFTREDRGAMVAAAERAWGGGVRDRTVAAALVAYAGPEHPLHGAASDVVMAVRAEAIEAIAAVARGANGIAATPGDRAAWASLVRGLLALDQLPRAIAGLTAAIDDGHLGLDGWMILALELCTSGRVTAARTVIAGLAKLGPSPDLAAVHALLAIADDEFEIAAEAVARGEALNPGAALVSVAAYALAIARADAPGAALAARRARALGVASSVLALVEWRVEPPAQV